MEENIDIKKILEELKETKGSNSYSDSGLLDNEST